jgi:Tfp pilus assembly protein PilZ
MPDENLEKRTCIRFRIPGATIKYKAEKKFLRKHDYIAEFCPVLDLSRGGIRFLAQELLKFESRVELKISIPGETSPLVIKGVVRWYSPNSGKSYKYQIGVQFLPYGESSDHNYPGVLTKVIALEQRFLDETSIMDAPADGKKEEFSI